LAQARLEDAPAPLRPAPPERSALWLPGFAPPSMLPVVILIIALHPLQALGEPGDKPLATWNLEELPPMPRHHSYHRSAPALASEAVALREALADELDDGPLPSLSSLSNGSSVSSPVVDESPLVGRYPGVQRALEAMPQATAGELRDLERRMRDERERLQVEAQSSLNRMDEALKLKRTMTQEEARVRTDKQKVQELRTREIQVDEIRSKLKQKAHYMLDRKIRGAAVRIKRRRGEFDKAQQLVKARAENEEAIKEKAQSLLQQRSRALDSLRSADSAVRQAQEKLQESEISFRTARVEASRGVEAYKHSIARKAAAASAARRVEEEVSAAEASMTKLISVREAEERSIDKITAIKKKRLMRNVLRFEADAIAVDGDLAANKNKYVSLEADERKLHGELKKMKADFTASGDALTRRERDILQSAETSEGKRAEAADDYAYQGWPDTSEGNDADGFAF